MRYNDYFNENAVVDIIRAATPAASKISGDVTNTINTSKAFKYSNNGATINAQNNAGKTARAQIANDRKARVAEAKIAARTAVKQAKLNRSTGRTIELNRTKNGVTNGVSVGNYKAIHEEMFLNGYYDALYDIENY